MSEAQQRALDLEELAAYIDGRLDGDSKARMTARLADDPEAYELFVESLRAIEEEAAVASGDAEVVAHPSARKPTWIVGSLAAVLGVVAIGVGLLLYQPWLGPTTRLVRMLAPERLVALRGLEVERQGSAVDWYDPGWSRTRSRELPPLVEAELAFRLGASAIDLRAAAAAGDQEALRHLLSRAAAIAGKTEKLALMIVYERLDPADPALNEKLAQVEELADDVFAGRSLAARRLAMGRWAETGRLAAVAGDVAALRARRYGRARPALAADDPQRAAVEAQLAEIDRLRAQSQPDLSAIAAAYERLIYQLAG